MKNKSAVLPGFTRQKTIVAAMALTLGVCGAGCGKGKNPVPGLTSFQADVLQSRLYVSFVSTTLNWDQGITVPIPGLIDATVGVTPSLSGPGTVFQFSIGLASLLGNGKTPPLAGLPDGRSLPDVSGGQLPHWDARVGGLKMSLYLSDDAFGLFVPLSFSINGVGLPAQISVQIDDDRGNLIGRAYALPVDAAGAGSGLFVLLPYLGSGPSATTGTALRGAESM